MRDRIWRARSFCYAKYGRQASSEIRDLQKEGKTSIERTKLENWAHDQSLEVTFSRATEFSQTSRLENLNPHTFNSKRYNFQQIPPSELKVMGDFPKFWTKYVGAHLDPVLPCGL